MATIDSIGSSPTFRPLLTEVARVAPRVDREALKLLAFSEFNGLEVRNCPAYIRERITRERVEPRLDGSRQATRAREDIEDV